MRPRPPRQTTTHYPPRADSGNQAQQPPMQSGPMSVSRKRGDTVINGVRYDLETLPPRQAFVTLAKIVRQLGPGPAEALTDSAKAASILKMPIDEAAKYLMFMVLRSLDTLDPNDLLSIAEDLLVGKLTVAGALVNNGRDIDVYIPDVYTMLSVVRFALELNYLPTSDASPTNAGVEETWTENR